MKKKNFEKKSEFKCDRILYFGFPSSTTVKALYFSLIHFVINFNLLQIVAIFSANKNTVFRICSQTSMQYSSCFTLFV